MPEGDTVYRTARLLDRSLSGQRLSRTDFRVPQHATADLSGGTVVETVSRGKHLLTRIDRGAGPVDPAHAPEDGGRLEGAHAAASGGRGRRTRPGRPRDGRGPRRWGSRSASSSCSTARPRTTLVGHLGPDLLGPDWDEERRSPTSRADPERPLREALLDQTNLAGIGNMYAAELCFTSGVHPQTPVGGRARPAPAGPPGPPDARAQQGAAPTSPPPATCASGSGCGSTAATGRRAALRHAGRGRACRGRPDGSGRRTGARPASPLQTSSQRVASATSS